MPTANEAFIQGLVALGYVPQALPNRPDHLVIDYVVETGPFAGRPVRLGFLVPPDFPVTPPSGPHVSPHVLPIRADGQHPAGAIHGGSSAAFAEALGGEWQYWSRPHPGWPASKRTVAAYMSHIWRLWDSQ